MTCRLWGFVEMDVEFFVLASDDGCYDLPNEFMNFFVATMSFPVEIFYGNVFVGKVRCEFAVRDVRDA